MKNTEQSKILWLRISYWVGAVADAIVGVRMLIPSAMAEAGHTYAMGTSASLMFGWTLLLIWADRKPLERKGVLLLTIFPVISGIMAAAAIPLLSGLIPLSKALTEAHGGTLTLNSAPGQGTTVAIRLPATRVRQN